MLRTVAKFGSSPHILLNLDGLPYINDPPSTPLDHNDSMRRSGQDHSWMAEQSVVCETSVVSNDVGPHSLVPLLKDARVEVTSHVLEMSKVPGGGVGKPVEVGEYIATPEGPIDVHEILPIYVQVDQLSVLYVMSYQVGCRS